MSWPHLTISSTIFPQNVPLLNDNCLFIRFFSCLLPPDLGRHRVGSVLFDGRWERADPNGHRLWHCPSSGTSAQSPGGQSSGMKRQQA